MDETEALLVAAHQIYRDSLSHSNGRPPIDDDAVHKMFRRQKAALTRARNSGDPKSLLTTCQKTIREWDDMLVPWRDSWDLWDKACRDAAREMECKGVGLTHLAEVSKWGIARIMGAEELSNSKLSL